MTSIDVVTRRVTGPSCNFITALTRKVWAFNEGNKGQWREMEEDDVIVLHQTGDDYIIGKRKSAIIGFAVIGKEKDEKSELWWADEVKNNSLNWPYWISLKAMYLFGETSNIDTSVQVHQKDKAQLKMESDALSLNCVTLTAVNKEAEKRNLIAFPHNGSTSKVRPEMISVIMDLAKQMPAPTFETNEAAFDNIANHSVHNLTLLSKEDLLAELINYERDKDKEHHKTPKKPLKQRIEDQKQKALVAQIEDQTCQVCGFREEYKNSQGKTKYIIDIDHIEEKNSGGGEEGKNLWALCPNCHRKKTTGIIKVNLKKREFKERGKRIKIRDNHLFNCLDAAEDSIK
jgi:5-methylcytosine-specific restriction endonuclease McrA